MFLTWHNSHLRPALKYPSEHPEPGNIWFRMHNKRSVASDRIMMLLPRCPPHLVQHRRSPSDGPCFQDNASSVCLQLMVDYGFCSHLVFIDSARLFEPTAEDENAPRMWRMRTSRWMWWDLFFIFLGLNPFCLHSVVRLLLWCWTCDHETDLTCSLFE